MEASVSLQYNNKNITVQLAQYLLAFSYTDRTQGDADEIGISLEDTDGNWSNAWYPEKGASLQATIIYGGQTLECGKFYLDEVQIVSSTNGDVVTIKGLSAGGNKKLRTRASNTHANKSLQQIAQTVADNAGLTLVGTINNIIFERAHQYRETDLSFLNRLGSDYGYLFSVRGNQLTFTHYKELEARAPSLSLNKTDFETYTLNNKSAKTYASSTVSYYSQQKKKQISYTTNADDDTGSDDDLADHSRTEDEGQAQAKSDALLHNQNSREKTIQFTTPGNLLLVSGNNVAITGIGVLSGTYHLEECSHILDRSNGYGVNCSGKKV